MIIPLPFCLLCHGWLNRTAEVYLSNLDPLDLVSISIVWYLVSKPIEQLFVQKSYCLRL